MAEATQHGGSQKPPPAFLHEDLPPAVLAYAQRLNDHDPEVRRTAVQRLGQMPMLQKEVIPAVAALLNDQDFGVRRAAVDTLGREHSLPKEVVQAVAARLEDQTPAVRQSALETLGTQQNLPEEILQSLALLLKDQSFNLRFGAMKILRTQQNLPGEILQSLILLLKDQSSELRQSAAETLGTQQNLPGEILPSLILLLKDQSSELRQSAAEILGTQQVLSREILQALKLLLEDQSSVVRLTTLETLGFHPSMLPDTILRAIEARLEDQDPEVQQSAMHVLLNKPYTTTGVDLDELSLWVRDRLGDEWDNEVETDPESRQSQIGLNISAMLNYLHSEGVYDDENKVLQSLRDVIAVTGDYQDAFCCTASQYVEWQWGPVGLEILQKLSSRLSNLGSFNRRRRRVDRISRDSEHEILFWYHVSGQSSQDVANTLRLLIWVSGAIRDLKEEVNLYSPAILCHKDLGTRFTIEWRVSELRRPECTPNQVGTCWNRSFRHFNVATSFPIPPRPVGFIGLEVPLGLVSDLAQIEYMLPYLDAFVLKGQRTALIPLKYNRDATQKVTAVQWHLIESPTDHLSMDMPVVHEFEPSNLGCGPRADYNPLLKSEDIRHFVGLYEGASLHVGAGDCSSIGVRPVVDGEDGVTRPSEWSLVWQRTLTLSSSISLLGGGSIGASTSFSFRRRTTPTSDVPRDLGLLVDSACKNLTLLYDIRRKTAWLVPEICAIFHLLHVSFTRLGTPPDPPLIFPTSDEIHLDLKGHYLRLAKALKEEEHRERLKGFVKFFRLMKEDIIYKSEGRRWRLGNFFRQGNRLAGVDFETLANFPDMITPLNVQVDDQTGGPWVEMFEANWNQAVKCITGRTGSGQGTGMKVVSLLCDDLRGSPPIRPIPDQRRCRSWHPIPEGCDYMVTTVQCLQLLTNNCSGWGKISPKHWWTEGDTRPFDFQACQHGCRWCNRLQRMVSREPSGDSRRWADDFVRKQSQRALCAIIFGSRAPSHGQ